MQIAELKQEIEISTREYVTTLPARIENQEDYLVFAAELLEIKKRINVIMDRLEPEKKKAYGAYQGWMNLIKELSDPYLEREKFNKAEMSRWDTEQEEIRRAEERRLQEEARKREEEERLAAALAAEAEGDRAAAEAIIEEEIYVPPVVVAKATPQVQGISYRDDWDLQIINPKLVPDEYKIIDEVKVRKVVKAMKGSTNIPGIKVFSKRVIAAGRR